VFLKIFHNGSFFKVKPFVDDQISIGSGEGLSLQLEGLSSWHVLIEKQADKYFIFDLGSEEGTYLNGEKVTGEMELVSGAKLTLGDYEIEFSIGPPQDLKENTKPKAVDSSVISKSKPVSFVEGDSSVAKQSPSDTASYKSKQHWNTFAPPSEISDLDTHLEPSIGNLIEVIVAWKERILSTYHFYKKGTVYIGSSKECQISVPNLLGIDKYKLLQISKGAKICMSHEVKGVLIQGKDRATRMFHNLNQRSDIIIKPYEMVRLDFQDVLKVYVRTVNKPPRKPILSGLLNLSFSESVSVFLAILLTSFLIFYAGFYGPAFLLKDESFLEKDIRVAVVKFEKIPKVDYNLGTKNQKPVVRPKPKKVVKIKPKLRIPKKVNIKKSKITNLRKRKTRVGQVAAQAPGRKKRLKKITVGSVRPGGSIKTGKQGSTAKTVAPDPSKVGLLGVFGGGGSLKKLDKGATGSGGLVGLAKESTGYAGTQDSYAGEGVGTQTKQLGSGGQGSSLVGIGGIKTKGRGGSVAGTGTGGLGTRGRISIEFSESDIDVEGEIDRAGILRVLRQNTVKFNNCYQYSLQQESSLQGTLKMQWEILPNGNVQSVSVVSDGVKSKILSDCVGRILKNLNFPAPPSGQIPRVAFPFIFSI